MAPRRTGTQDSLSPNAPPSPAVSRSTSPSSGFTQFLSKPSKWFTRSVSGSKVPAGTNEARPSMSSAGGRKHKISRPTDPRPIMDGYTGGASKSVLDLSARPAGSMDIPQFHAPSTPSSPVVPHSPGGLGDLRNMSRRGWSRSADDLSKVSAGEFSPVKAAFQERIAEYRARSDSSASAASPSSPSSIHSPYSGRHPFPTVDNSSPSSSPPRSSTLPTLAVSVSAPIVEEGSSPRSFTPTHVHTRSHSFTPKLPSKLATPRFPPSPQREGLAPPQQDTETRELEKPALLPLQTQAHPSCSNRPGFGFAFGGMNQNKVTGEQTPVTPSPVANRNTTFMVPSTAANRATTLLAPPMIIEPDQDGDQGESLDSKRASHIVFNSGFINRLSEVPTNFHHANLQLSKGWKPYKLELKGSKLYFYKPPGDRSAAIKDLFPTSLVPPSQEEEDTDAEMSGVDELEGASAKRKGKGREETGTQGRKKRAFWGRTTHPDLIRDADGIIVKGSFEALVHETVFATTFFSPLDGAEEGNGEDATKKRDGKWQEFASSVLLSLPFIVCRNVFEAEFIRRCSHLIRVDDNAKEAETSRVGWLAKEYLRHHGKPADQTAWDEWKQDTIPDITLTTDEYNPSAGMPSSVSTQALYSRTPLLGTASPDFNTFSPRPDDQKMVSLLEALSGGQELSRPRPTSPGVQQQNALRPGFQPTNNRGYDWMATLNEEGLSRDVLLMLDPFLIARSLTLFHRSVLERAPDNFTSDFAMASDTDGHESLSSSFASLFGSDDQPHWLTKLLLLQILGADTSGASGAAATQLSSPGRRSEDRSVQTSRTHSRSEVISVWARVGELCRGAGDDCSWRAISAALCSRPVARLEKAWKRVDPQALAVVEWWVYPRDNDQLLTVKEPQVTPWGGDTKIRLSEELGKARGDSGDQMIGVEALTKARTVFEKFRRSFSLCPRKVSVHEDEIGDDVRRLVAYWSDMALEGGGTSSLAIKFQRVEQFMSLSLAAEPRRKGLFEPYFWSRGSNQGPQTSLIPLLFPESCPTVTLVDRTQLIRGRLDSDATDMQHLRRNDAQDRHQLQRFDMNQDFTKRLILGQGGTAISVYNGDLVLVVQSGGFEADSNSRPSSRAPSRPPSSITDTPSGVLSRAPSIRVKPSTGHTLNRKPSTQGLDRKSSMARRSSLPSVSQKQNFVTSEPSSDPPLRVVVQAGTLNNLVTILVHGLQHISVSVADDNGEMSLREGMTRELMVDRAEFAKVWWNVFRSFVTPLVFFELLRKLYISSQPTGSSPNAAEYVHVANKRNEALIATKEWLTIGGGAQDILDDIQLFNAVRSFLESADDHVFHQSASFKEPSAQQAWNTLLSTKKSLDAAFTSQTMRPPITRGHAQKSALNGSRTRKMTTTREPPDMDRMDPEDLVDNLDGMACAAFSNVTEEDLYITADLLEVQSADRIGWFSLRETGTSEETIDIQTIYSHIQEVEPSSMISELTQEVLYRLLPPGVRSCIRAYAIIRKWLISKIVAPRLGLRARQARMELLVQAIEVARLRNAETPTNAQVLQPCVRSFVETVITSAILSVESRMHHRAWQSVAHSRGCQCDSLSSLLLRPYIQDTASRDCLTVDMGWLLERMLEVIATPDVIDSSSQEGQSLVNFDKRRHLCNLISKASILPASRKNPSSDEANRRGFERLNNVEREAIHLQFDHRGIKEEATKEASQFGMNGPHSAKKVVRPFNRIIVVQMEKNRRDKNLRSRLQREKLIEQSKIERRDDILNKAMRPRKAPMTNPQKQHRNKKSMSAFLNFMRPISSAFGADIHPVGLKRTAAELNFTTTGKPALVLSVLDARVAQFINNERSYTFQLDTEDGGHYLLQAMNKREMNKWLETLTRVMKMAAKRRLTYIGNSPKPQIADHIHDRPIVASRDPKAVFGVELEFLLQREAGDEQILPGTVPRIIEQCLMEVETRGLSEVGIYRIAGATSEINTLKEAYNRGESPIQPSTDIHAVCDLVKSWFRVLPEPVFPSSSYHDVMQAMRLENLDERLASVRNVVQALPQANFDLLRRVSEHLDRVTDFEEHNHMTAEALAIVFSPNLLRAPQNDFVMILNNMGHSHKLVKALITHLHVIFDEADPEAEIHSEDELDSPILEEDEEAYEEDDDPQTQMNQLTGSDQEQSPHSHTADSGNPYTQP